MNREEFIWKGQSSALINFKIYLICGLLCFLVVPLIYAYWKYIENKNTIYELTNQRLKIRTGVLNKKINDLELYRIKDYTLEQPFYLRLFHLSNLKLDTSDKSQHNFIIPAIENGEELMDKIRELVESLRVEKNVREVEFLQ